MNFIRNVKIKTRLLFLVIIVIVLFGSSIVGWFYSLDKVKIGSKLYNEIKSYNDIILRVALLRSDLNEIRVKSVLILAETNRGKMKQLQIEIKQLSYDIDKSFNEILSMIPEDGVNRVIMDTQSTWQKFRDESISDILAGNMLKAKELITDIQKQRYEKFMEQVTIAIKTVVLKIVELEENTDKIIWKNIRFITLATVFLFIIILIFMLFITDSITEPLKKVTLATLKIADWDLSQKEIDIKSRDEIGQLANTFSKMVNKLIELIERINQEVNQIVTSSNSLVSVSNNSSTASVQLAQTIEQIAKVTQDVAQSSQLAATSSQKTQELSKEGFEALQNMYTKTDTIKKVITDTYSNVTSLTSRSKSINEMINIITDIADQTNLLSLNAAIEAARAGDSGRGFAVVATEIRKLADSSFQQVQRISKIIQEILVDAENTEKITGKSVNEIEEGISLIEKAHKLFLDIIQQADNIATQVENIATSIEEISASTEEVSAQAEEQSSLVGEVTTNSAQLRSIADSLKKSVESFKL